MTTDTGTDSAGASGITLQLDNPALYLNRELAWLSYNRRLLHEAENDAAPLLERVAFLAGFSENLDHFFMHRVAGLKLLQSVAAARPSVDGRTAGQQLAACRDHVQVYIADEAFVYFELCYLLARHGIQIQDHGSLTPAQVHALRERYLARIRPLMTPMAVDGVRPFRGVSNLTNNLLVEAGDPHSGDIRLVRIELPVSQHLPRLVRIPEENTYIPIEQVIVANLDDLLPGADIRATGMFRVTRSALAEGDDSQVQDLLNALPDDGLPTGICRHTRLEVSAGLPANLTALIALHLGVNDPDDIYSVNSLMAARDLAQIAGMPIAGLRYSVPKPSGHPRFSSKASILDEVAQNGPVFLQHPYQAYDRTVLPMLREAVADPDVLAIKATIRRDTRGSGLLAPLIMAARRGKHVVVVALTGTGSDKAADDKWAAYLESTGIQVSFGPTEHSPHARATLIVRHEEDGSLGRIVHVASGEHDSAAKKPLADVGLISAESDVGNDASELFNLLTSGLMWGRHFDALLVAPQDLKSGLIERIRREQEIHQQLGGGRIIIKANSLDDIEITRALYAAGRAGVKIDLIIRADCRLRPGLAGLTENVRVVSLLGRYREHARVYYFRDGGKDAYYIGSADPIDPTLTRRVDVLVPIRGALRKELAATLRLQLDSRRGAWQMDANGDYRREYSGSDSDAQTQMLLRAQRAELQAQGV